METPLTGTVALVTGGSRGIGQACARQLGELGATVLITGTSVESVDSGVRALKDCGLADANGYVVDVRDQASIDALFDRAVGEFGRVDILVNNAGVGGGGPTHELPYEAWERVVDINLNGVFRVTRSWLQRSGSRERGWG